MNLMKISPTDRDAAEKSRTFYDMMMKRLEMQNEDAGTIDQKISAWFQGAPVVATLLLALLGTLKDRVTVASIMVASVGVALFLIAQFLLFFAHHPRVYKRGLDWETVASYVNNPEISEGEFLYAIGHALGSETIPDNFAVIKRKAALFGWSVRAFALSNAAFIIAAVVMLGAHA